MLVEEDIHVETILLNQPIIGLARLSECRQGRLSTIPQKAAGVVQCFYLKHILEGRQALIILAMPFGFAFLHHTNDYQMEPGTIMGAVAGLLIAGILNAIVIWIIGKLGLGIEVNNFGTALAASFLSAAIWFLIDYLHILDASAAGGWMLHLARIIVSALVLLFIGSVLKGMVTKGFIGAIIAGFAMSVVYWLINYLLVSLAK